MIVVLAVLACHHPSIDTGADSDTVDTDAHTDSDTPDTDTDVVDTDTDTGGWVAPPDYDWTVYTPSADNLLLPYDVAVDAANRKAYVTSLVRPLAARVDVDAGALEDVYDLGAIEMEEPQVVVDGVGFAWVMNGADVIRLSAKGTVRTFPTSAKGLHTIVPLPGGGVVVSGKDGAVLSIDEGGKETATRTLDDSVASSALVDDGAAVGLLTRASDGTLGLRVVDASTLEDVRFCPTPPIQGENLSWSPSGRFLMSTSGQIAAVPCPAVADPDTGDSAVPVDTGTSVSLDVGNDVKNMVVDGDVVLALDRVGDDDARGGNWGEVRRYTLDLEPIDAYPSGKHSGYGELDPTTDVVWMNSEGTTEVWGVPATGGDPVARVRLGLHVEELARDPASPSVVWFTGRLSGTIGRLDLATGGRVLVALDDAWPVAPLLHDGVLYVVDQLTNTILVVDPTTLAVTATLDPGLGDNVVLQIDDLVWDDARGTLFLTDGQDDLLVEVDPDTGAAIGTWPLGGGALADPSLGGRLMVGTAGDALVTLRTQDGVLTRIDPTRPEPTAVTTLTADEVAALDEALLLPALYVSADGATAWAGGCALETADLSRTPERDVDGSRVVGEMADGTVLGLQPDQDRVAGFDATGAVVTSAPLQPSNSDVAALYAPDWDGRLEYVVVSDARLLTAAVPPVGAATP